MSGRALVAALLLAAGGCASTPAPPPPKPIQLAILAAPLLGAPEAADALYAVTDALSLEAELAVVLVVGPVYGAGKESLEVARDELIGALGALAAPVHVALGPGDLERDPDLLTLLAEALPHRAEELAYSARVSDLEVVVLGPAGEEPAESETASDQAPRRVLVGGQPGFSASSLRVTHGPALRLDGALLEIPALGSGEPIYALGTLDAERGRLTIRLRKGEEDLGEPVEGPWN